MMGAVYLSPSRRRGYPERPRNVTLPAAPPVGVGESARTPDHPVSGGAQELSSLGRPHPVRPESDLVTGEEPQEGVQHEQTIAYSAATASCIVGE